MIVMNDVVEMMRLTGEDEGDPGEESAVAAFGCEMAQKTGDFAHHQQRRGHKEERRRTQNCICRSRPITQ